MNIIAAKLFRPLYRQHPINGMIITAGLANALIGGSNDRPGLFTFGLSLMGLALAARWIRWQSRPIPIPSSSSQYYLPAASPSRPALPPLSRRSHHRR